MKTVEIIPSKDRSQFSQVKYQFFLDAPFEISNMCCHDIKKEPAGRYHQETGRFPMTGQTAAESRLRTQVWLREGCNAFTASKKMSNPLAFWTEQDILAYIKQNNIDISEEYGEIVFEGDVDEESLMPLDAYELFDLDRPILTTTGAQRTGCMVCGYGLHLEKHPNRMDRLYEKYPKVYDWLMRGGAFDPEDGLWKPFKGLGMWFIFEWCNVHGNMGYELPDMGYYKMMYGNKETDYWLRPESSWFENKLNEALKRSEAHAEN